MTLLSNYLDRLRAEIRRKAEQAKNLAKPHRFPCPHCEKDVHVEYKPDGSAKLLHKVPGCPTFDKPSKAHNSDLLAAYVHWCKPTMRFPALDGLEDGKAFK